MTGLRLLAGMVGVFAVAAWLPPPASANPATPMSVIEAAATQLCEAIGLDPTEFGVRAAMRGLHKQGLDELDAALVLLTAIHHVCPDYQEVATQTLPAISSGAAAAPVRTCPRNPGCSRH